jgi:hypothetical protein
MTTYYNNNEGILPTGTTPTAANSANPSAQPITASYLSTTIGAGCSIASDTSTTYEGRNSLKFVLPGGSSLNDYITWLMPSTSATAAFCGYFLTPSDIGSNGCKFAVFSSGATTPCCSIGVSATTGKLIIGNAAATAVATGTGPSIPASTVVRFEIQVSAFSLTVGAATAQYYLGDSVTVQDTCSTTGQAFGAANADRIRLGVGQATTNAHTFWLFNSAISDSATAIGPTHLPFTTYFKTAGGLWTPATVSFF